jgi:hypothetical protein
MHKVEQGQWNNHAVDDRGGKIVQWTDSHESVKNAHSGFKVCFPDDMLEGDAHALDPVV